MSNYTADHHDSIVFPGSDKKTVTLPADFERGRRITVETWRNPIAVHVGGWTVILDPHSRGTFWRTRFFGRWRWTISSV